jgi:hypothetical protein
LKKSPPDDGAAIHHTSGLEVQSSACNHVRQVVEHAANRRMCRQDGAQKTTISAADIHERPKAGEVVRLHHGAPPRRSLFRHHHIEAGGRRRVLLQVCEEPGAVGPVERRLARCYAVRQLPPGAPVRLLTIEDGPGAKRASRFPLQQHRKGREVEAGLFALCEHAFAGKKAHHAIERQGMRADRPGEIVDAPRPIPQEISDAEFGDDMEGLGQPVADDQPAQLCRCRLVAGVHGSPRVLPATLVWISAGR